MSGKTVTRSVRFEADIDERIGAMAKARGQSVSAFIRTAVEEMTTRDERRARLEQALRLAAELPIHHADRDEMWGVRSRVPD